MSSPDRDRSPSGPAPQTWRFRRNRPTSEVLRQGWVCRSTLRCRPKSSPGRDQSRSLRLLPQEPRCSLVTSFQSARASLSARLRKNPLRRHFLTHGIPPACRCGGLILTSLACQNQRSPVPWGLGSLKGFALMTLQDWSMEISFNHSWIRLSRRLRGLGLKREQFPRSPTRFPRRFLRSFQPHRFSTPAHTSPSPSQQAVAMAVRNGPVVGLGSG